MLLGFQHVTEPDQPICYEDSAWVWNGNTNDHTDCVPVDDLVPQQVRRAADLFAESTDGADMASILNRAADLIEHDIIPQK